MAPVTYPRRLHELAVEDPDALALTVVDPGNETALSRAQTSTRARLRWRGRSQTPG
jgi:hypothetical protein